MYSIVLATMLTAGSAAPAGCGFFGGGCCGYSCHGGCCFSSCCSCSSYCNCTGVYSYNCGCSSWSYGCCSCCCGCWSYSGWSCSGCCSGTYSSCSFGCWGGSSGCCSYSGCCSCSCMGGGVYYLPPYSIGCCCCGCVSNCSSVVVAPVCGVCACYEPPMVVAPASPVESYQVAPGISYPSAAPATTIYPGSSIPSGIQGISPSSNPVILPQGEVLPKPKSPASADLNSARVVIKAPLNMTIRVNGEAIQRNQAEMTFRTPKLHATGSYGYSVEAEVSINGKAQKESRTITVQAGKETVVDFNSSNLAPREAIVNVNLPEKARFFVDGKEIQLPAGQKSFRTPALIPGEKYQYEMKAEINQDGKTIDEIKSVDVMAGKTVSVEFSKLNNQLISTVSR